MAEVRGKNLKKFHGRAPTAYGYLLDPGNQGPHTVAHVTTQVSMVHLQDSGYDLSKLLGTKLIPRPGVVYHLTKELLRLHPDSGLDPQRISSYFARYAALFEKARTEPKVARLFGRLLEMQPTQTYKWETGVPATKAEIKGKGERRTKAVKDLADFSGMVKGGDIPAGARTVDLSDSGQSAIRKLLAADRCRQLGAVACRSGEDLSDAEEYGDSDTETELVPRQRGAWQLNQVLKEILAIVRSYELRGYFARPGGARTRALGQALAGLASGPRPRLLTAADSSDAALAAAAATGDLGGGGAAAAAAAAATTGAAVVASGFGTGGGGGGGAAAAPVPPPSPWL
jgi:hypothetical protein